MAVSGIIFQMITLFIMMFAGYLAARAGLISPSFRRGLSSLVLSTAFPCCIVSSVLQSGGAPGSMLVALGVSVAFFALMIALATILGYFRLYRFPQGGSVDFAMVPILIYCLRWGPAWSLSCCFVNGVLQFFLGGGIALSWQSMLLDYVVAYTLVFLCGFAAGKKLGWLWGTILAGLGRWVSLTLSGGLLWYMYMPEKFLGLPMVDPWVYSMIFNGVLIVLVTVVNLIVLGIFQSVPALRQKLLTKQN